jgi:hypothetical protein
MRLDRTSLNEPLSRHSKGSYVPSIICSRCEMDDDTISHYLFDCPALASERYKGTLRRWYPLHYHMPTNQNCIIAFTDGSAKLSNHSAGAGTIVCFPSSSPIIINDHINNTINSTSLSIKVAKPIDINHQHHWDSDYMSISNGSNNIAELYAVSLALKQSSINIIMMIITSIGKHVPLSYALTRNMSLVFSPKATSSIITRMLLIPSHTTYKPLAIMVADQYHFIGTKAIVALVAMK